MEKKTKDKLKYAAIRFCRVIVPQIPTFLASINMYIDQKYAPALLFAGAIATGLDKFARDMGWYGKTA